MTLVCSLRKLTVGWQFSIAQRFGRLHSIFFYKRPYKIAQVIFILHNVQFLLRMQKHFKLIKKHFLMLFITNAILSIRLNFNSEKIKLTKKKFTARNRHQIKSFLIGFLP